MGTQVGDDLEVSAAVFKGTVKTVKYCMYMIRTQVGGMVQMTDNLKSIKINCKPPHKVKSWIRRQ